MSTTPNFSNFISNFTDLSNIDIVSSVSGQVVLQINPSKTDVFYGRYFCIGDLLIQFSDTSSYTDGVFPDQKNALYTIDFPYNYDATPYTVMLIPTNINGNTVTATPNTFDKNSFTVLTDTDKGWVNFIAIGPRPASLYTA